MYFFISSSDSFRTPRVINKSYNAFCSDKCLKEVVDGKLQCHCGEDTPDFDWSWQDDTNSSNIKVLKDGREILFHPVYSSGTAAVRGDAPFDQNCHYYWEIKMISKLYGTDVMIGIGTTKIDISDWKYKFCSMLGIDTESWGYSYHGNIQHNKLRRKYGSQFGLGSIIGLHLDLCNGTLEYYLNRKPLGIAFRDLKGQQLYPMVSSTAAQSAVRMTCCISRQSTLQMLCLKSIMKHPHLHRQYRKIPGLTRLYDKQYVWMVPTPEHDEKKRLAELEEDVTLSLVNGRLINKNKKFKPIRWVSVLYDEEIEDTGNTSDVENDPLADDSSSNEVSDMSSEETDGASTSRQNIEESLETEGSLDENEGNDRNLWCQICKGPTNKCQQCRLRSKIEDEDCSSDSSQHSEPTLIL